MIKTRAKYFFLLPGVLWILAFTLFPLLYSLYISLTDFRLGKQPQFIGLTNFGEILNGVGEGLHPAAIVLIAGLLIGLGWSLFERQSGRSTALFSRLPMVLGITLVLIIALYFLNRDWWQDEKASDTAQFSAFLMVGSTSLTLILGTFIAWIFNHDLPLLRQMRAIITMPLFAAPIALGFLGVIIFNEVNGPLNNILQGFGLQRVQWIIDPWGARFTILITDTWQWTPFVFIVVLAAMQSIPDDLYESARLDTKSNWILFRYITLPLIAPALGTVALLRLVETIKIIDIPISLTGGGPGAVTQTYGFYIYQIGLRGSFQLGDASALSYLVVLVAMIISTIYFSRVRARFD
jgi:multiple sugar transport system permease protein